MNHKAMVRGELCIFMILVAWQSLPAFLGGMIFFLWTRMARLSARSLFFLGTLIFLIYWQKTKGQTGFSLEVFFKDMNSPGLLFWKELFLERNASGGFRMWWEKGELWVWMMALLLGSMMACLESIFKRYFAQKENDFPQKKVLQEGLLLGSSLTSGEDCRISEKLLNQGVLVLGTTGGGKSITLRRFYAHAFEKKEPLVIIDGKPTEETVQWIQEKAAQHGKIFYGFNCADFWSYDFLSEGSHTELKDKIMALKDSWESDYYRSVAEDYLQTVLEVLKFSKEPFDLEKVASLLDYETFVLYVRCLNSSEESGQREHLKILQARVKSLSSYKQDDLKGLSAHLNGLVKSELGEFLTYKDGHTFSLKDVIVQKTVVYFALPSLRYPYFSRNLGKLIINDIKTAIDRQKGEGKIFTIFDEFSVFVGEQVLNLITMGRAKGVQTVLGTQGISDLKKGHPAFADQILNCVNTLICHRLNDHESAETVSKWGGMEDVVEYTHHVNEKEQDSQSSSVRRSQKYSVTPDMIKKELNPGDAFYMSKEETFVVDKIRVKYT